MDTCWGGRIASNGCSPSRDRAEGGLRQPLTWTVQRGKKCCVETYFVSCFLPQLPFHIHIINTSVDVGNIINANPSGHSCISCFKYLCCASALGKRVYLCVVRSAPVRRVSMPRVRPPCVSPSCELDLWLLLVLSTYN